MGNYVDETECIGEFCLVCIVCSWSEEVKKAVNVKVFQQVYG